MQPPRPFRGVPYDKDMFTFLPALANRDVLVDSPRKRKSMASDSQFTTPAPTMGYGPFGHTSPTESAGDLRAKKFQSSIPVSSPRESSTFKDHSDNATFRRQNNSGALWHSNERDFCEYPGYSSFAGQSQPNSNNDLSYLTQNPAGLMYKPSIWSPFVTEDFNQHGSHDYGEHVGGEDNHFHFPKSQSYGPQMHALTKVERSNSSDIVLEESQNLQESFPKRGAYIAGLDEDNCPEQSYKTETYPKMGGHGDSSSFARVDCAKTLGTSFETSIHNLDETNRILQQALRLLSASSGTSSTVNPDGGSQGSGGDATKIKSTPNFQIRNVSHSSVDGTPSKGDEDGLNPVKSIISGDKGSANVHDGLKLENGGLVLAEKLWDGILQLSSSVSVSAVAFFKSGERMLDFSWSGSVEVKGKVRLEAFEKYVQDLPRSRSRGLMVMSLWGKDGSSTASLKAMTEVARKYREGKRVGFAQLNKGLDMYICPHSDTVITILAKHGFFNGMTAVTEKSDPLIGCVVWRKHSTSVPATEATLIDVSHSETSPRKQSDENCEKMQTEIEGGKNETGNMSPEFCVDQPEQSMTPENKTLSVDVEISKPSSSFTLVPDQSLVFSDDEDLPEYDFGAGISESKSSVTVTVSITPETEQVSVSHVHQPVADQTRSESSTISRIQPDPRFQGQAQYMNHHHQSEVHNSDIQAQQEIQGRDDVIDAMASVPELVLQNISRKPEATVPSWPIEEKKITPDSMNRKNLYDDDDIPEWCPDFKKTIPEVTERPGPGPQPSMSPRFSFTDLATGRQLPTPPPLPRGPPPPRGLDQVNLLEIKHPTENQLSRPPPPPPSPLPPRGQFFDSNYLSAPHFQTPAVNVLIQAKQHPPPLPPMPPPGHLHRPPPPLPPTPPPLNQPHFSNKFMHNRAVPPPTHVRFQDHRYPPSPTPPLPPSMHEKTTAGNFMCQSPAGVSTQMQFQVNDNREAEGSRHEVLPPPPCFPPNPILFRPQFQNFQRHGVSNSTWRGSRP